MFGQPQGLATTTPHSVRPTHGAQSPKLAVGFARHLFMGAELGRYLTGVGGASQGCPWGPPRFPQVSRQPTTAAFQVSHNTRLPSRGTRMFSGQGDPQRLIIGLHLPAVCLGSQVGNVWYLPRAIQDFKDRVIHP